MKKVCKILISTLIILIFYVTNVEATASVKAKIESNVNRSELRRKSYNNTKV